MVVDPLAFLRVIDVAQASSGVALISGKASIKGLVPPLPEPIFHVNIADLLARGMLLPEMVGFGFPPIGGVSWASAAVGWKDKTLVETQPVMLKDPGENMLAVYQLNTAAAKAFSAYYQAGYELGVRVQAAGFTGPVTLLKI